MRDLAAIGAAYAEIDARFESDLIEARTRGDAARIARLEERQRINDQAYFVLCWGHIETEINDVCRSAIARKQASARWEERRGWDIYSLTDKRLSGLTFEDRVAIVTDRSGGKGSPYAKILTYYQLRNQIAHGGMQATRIDVSAVAQDFYVLQSQLKS